MVYERFDAAVAKINKFSEKLLVAVIGIMFFTLLLQITSRFVFFMPLPSIQDLIIFFLLTSVFLGSGSAVSANKHIAIEFLANSLPKKLERVVLLFADLVSIVFLGIVVYQAVVLAAKIQGSRLGSSPIPVSVYYFVVAMGSFLMLINYIKLFAEKMKKFNNREEK